MEASVQRIGMFQPSFMDPGRPSFLLSKIQISLQLIGGLEKTIKSCGLMKNALAWEEALWEDLEYSYKRLF